MAVSANTLAGLGRAGWRLSRLSVSRFSLILKAVAARILKSILLISLLLIEVFTTANADEVAYAVFAEGQAPIPGLNWERGDKAPTLDIEKQEGGKPAARLKGTFKSKTPGTFLFSSDTIQRVQFTGDESGSFTVLIPLADRSTPVTVKFIDDLGGVQALDFIIVYEPTSASEVPSKWKYDAGASISYLDYKQSTGVSSVSVTQIGLTPKGGVTYSLSDKIDFGASAFVTLFGVPLKTESSPVVDVSTPRFYGVNLRMGYKIHTFESGSLSLMTGPYFWGMLISSNDYGVVRLSGPQLFLVGRFLTPEGRAVVGYLKVASILDGGMSLSDRREFAVGGAYQVTAPGGKCRYMATLDLASAKFLIGGEEIQLNSAGLGLSMSF